MSTYKRRNTMPIAIFRFNPNTKELISYTAEYQQNNTTINKDRFTYNIPPKVENNQVARYINEAWKIHYKNNNNLYNIVDGSLYDGEVYLDKIPAGYSFDTKYLNMQTKIDTPFLVRDDITLNVVSNDILKQESKQYENLISLKNNPNGYINNDKFMSIISQKDLDMLNYAIDEVFSSGRIAPDIENTEDLEKKNTFLEWAK